MKHFVLTLVAAAALCSPVVAQNRVKTLSTNSATLNVNQLRDAEGTVQVTRYFFAGYNTLCLPLSMSAEQLANAAKDLKVERLYGMKQEGNTLNLYFVECTGDGIEAGVPYLVFSPMEQNLRAKNTESMGVDTDLKTIRLDDGAGNVVCFGSSWEMVQKEGRYGIPAQQDVYPLESVLIRTDAEKAFLPTRCGFTWERQGSGATELTIRHLGKPEATALRAVTVPAEGSEAMYNVSGQRVSEDYHGIVVVNGKKVRK